MVSRPNGRQLHFSEFTQESPAPDSGSQDIQAPAPDGSASTASTGPEERPVAVASARQPPREPLVLVIDAPALIYQVFHAIASVTGPSGQQLNAVFGFTRDLLDLLEKYRPSHLFCAMDHPADTFRHEIYPDYKSTRAAMPEELRPQFPAIRRMLDAMRIPVLELAGFEADDILATIADQAEQRGVRCWLVTNDKDCRQLISDQVLLFNPRKSEWMDQAKLNEVWGVRPDQVVDFQALVGDSVDAIPGVPLIGPKIASHLLQQFDTIDGIFRNLDQVAGTKRRQNLKQYREQALMSRRLAELDRDTPVTVDWRGGEVGHFDGQAVAELCREFGFRRLAERLQQHADPVDPAASAATPKADSETPIADSATRRVLDAEQLEAMTRALREEKEILVLAIATSGRPVWGEPLGLGLASSTAGDIWYVPIQADGEAVCPTDVLELGLKPLWEDPQLKKAGPQLKEAEVLLRAWGWRLAGAAFDFSVADYLVAAGERSHDLADLAERYLGKREPSWVRLLGEGRQRRQARQCSVDELAGYSASALQVCRELRPLLWEQLRQMELLPLFQDVEMPLLSALAEMEFQGIHLDVPVLDRIGLEFIERLCELEKQIYELAEGPLNIDSRLQLARTLFQQLGLPVLKKTKTGASTDAEVLSELAALHPLPAKIIEYRQLAKLKGTYVDALPELVHPRTGRVHTSFRQDVAATGRLSSQDPNLQNIPIRSADGRRIRSAFTAAPQGWTLLAADYSQIELRVLAHFCGDQVLIGAFESGQDIHAQVASEIHGVPLDQVSGEMRRQAKAINFGVIYGQSPFGLAKALQISKEEAALFIDAYFARYPSVDDFVNRTLDECRHRGYVTTILGRRRQVSGIRSAERRAGNRQRTMPERIAVNTVIQGSAADLIKIAILRVNQALRQQRHPARLLLTIHDELLLETPPERADDLARLVRSEMEAAAELRTPIVVDVKIGANWAECEVWREPPPSGTEI